jgi:hypothetical protein
MSIMNYWELKVTAPVTAPGSIRCTGLFRQDMWESEVREEQYCTAAETIDLVGDPADPEGLKINHHWYLSHTTKRQLIKFGLEDIPEPNFTSKDDVVKAIKEKIESYKKHASLLENLLVLADSATSFQTDYKA